MTDRRPEVAYLVVDGEAGIFHAGFDLKRARLHAKAIRAAVVNLPILEKTTRPEARSDAS